MIERSWVIILCGSGLSFLSLNRFVHHYPFNSKNWTLSFMRHYGQFQENDVIEQKVQKWRPSNISWCKLKSLAYQQMGCLLYFSIHFPKLTSQDYLHVPSTGKVELVSAMSLRWEQTLMQKLRLLLALVKLKLTK